MTDELRAAVDKLSEILNSENGCEYTDLSNEVCLGSLPCTEGQSRINILHLNIRSLHKNIDQLTLMLSALHDMGLIVHVIGICETFLTHESIVLIDLENYSGIHWTRDNRHGGGVSLYIHDSVRLIKEIDTPFNESFESCTAELKFRNLNFHVSEFYHIPNSDDRLFSVSIKKLLDCFRSQSRNY